MRFYGGGGELGGAERLTFIQSSFFVFFSMFTLRRGFLCEEDH